MRDKREYLPKLLEYIELANKIPANFDDFPSADYISRLTGKRTGREQFNFAELVDTYKTIFKDFPPDLYDYIFSDEQGLALDYLDAIEIRVDLLASLSYGLRTLAWFVMEEAFPEDGPVMHVNEYLEGLREQAPGLLARLAIKLFVDEEGIVQLRSTEFYDFLQSYRIEARRIRTCLVCQKVFWAKRYETWACGSKCGNTLRQRSYQSDKKKRADYNERRRANYAYKKAIDKKGVKRNGTI